MNVVKKIAIMTLSIFMILGITGCTNETTNSKAEENLSLYGEWKQTNSNDENSYQEATISENGTIVINWVTDDEKALYWAGTFDAPSEATKTYSWTSINDKSQTDNALLASSDDTKDFKYDNGVLSYEASAMGVTKTIKMKRK